MGARTGTGERRSATEWAKLVAEWEQSGLDRNAFAASRRVNARQLSWWRWRLRGAVRSRAVDIRLVKVDVEREPRSKVDHGRATELGSWELATSRGVLRVHEGISEVALEAVLAALVGKRPS
jgi:hypothetical protein